MNLQFELANKLDAKNLTNVSKDAFHTDFTVAGRKTIGGPPGYDSIEFHEKMILESSKFFKILLDGNIIGGFWFNFMNAEEAYLYRVFLDPEFHNVGVGLQVFDFLFHCFPSIKLWTLKVPVWNTRTPSFYIKLGFEITEKTDKFIYFQKELYPKNKR